MIQKLATHDTGDEVSCKSSDRVTAGRRDGRIWNVGHSRHGLDGAPGRRVRYDARVVVIVIVTATAFQSGGHGVQHQLDGGRHDVGGRRRGSGRGDRVERQYAREEGQVSRQQHPTAAAALVWLPYCRRRRTGDGLRRRLSS